MSEHAPDLEALAAALDGEVHGDPLHRRLVAQDASHYRVLPAALVYPRHADDCRRLVELARAEGVALIPRGGGTSLAGQCVGRGIVVDTSRHMTAVHAVDPDARTATVAPGITARDLNAALASHDLVFAPDPSTANRAVIGGLVGNNAWGPHAPADGTTREQVVALEAVLADGHAVRLGALDDPVAGDDADARRRAALVDTIGRHREALEAAFPAPGSGLCSNNGYPLRTLLDGRPWRADGPAFNEALLFAGAEGTLGLVTEVTVRLRPRRRERRLLCPHFDSVADALAAVPAALAAGACAVELLDRHLLGLTREHPGQAPNRFWLEGDPAAVLIIELADGVGPGTLADDLRAAGAHAVPAVEGEAIERVWALRRAALGLLMGQVAQRRAVTGLEDTAVPVARLPEYIAAVDRLVAAEGVDCVHYGSVSLGLVHLRPLLDLADAGDRARYRRLLDGLAELVRAHGGVWSTKHGDGRVRAPWLEAVYGPEVAAAMRAVKALYDPDGLFNPGKVVDAPDPLADLRATAARGDAPAAGGLDWDADRGLAAAAARCNGAGACRQAPGDGAMCPSYQATRDELHSTRGRANLFQQAFEADDPAAALAGDELHQALELCLSCKACRHECPARVDMARLKAEHLHRRHRARGMPLAARAIAAFAPLSALGARAPRLANALARRRLVRRLAGLARTPPALAAESLPAWLRRRPAPVAGPRGAVVLLLDPHTAWYEPAIGRAAIALLERLGYAVRMTRCVAAGRAAISQGALDRARRELVELAAAVEAAGPGDAPVIGLEPSELLTLRDEAPALLEGEARGRIEALAGRALLLEEWLAGAGGDALAEATAGGDAAAGAIALHVHCHAKALVGVEPFRGALAVLPGAAVEVIDAGCCGMAGAFGYRRETVDTSRAVAELALAPAVRALPEATTVAAPGVSCRQQILGLTGRRALHPAEVIAASLGVMT